MTQQSDAEFDAHWHDALLRDLGVIDPDEPTAVSHAIWKANYMKTARGEFTPKEREAIRAHLGLGPFAYGVWP